MAFFPPIPLIRRNLIIRKLKQCGAVSQETARSFLEAGVINPNGFKRVTEKLIRDKVLGRTSDGSYYVL